MDWGFTSEIKTHLGKKMSGVIVERRTLERSSNGKPSVYGGVYLKHEWIARRGSLVSDVKNTKKDAITDLLKKELTK